MSQFPTFLVSPIINCYQNSVAHVFSVYGISLLVHKVYKAFIIAKTILYRGHQMAFLPVWACNFAKIQFSIKFKINCLTADCVSL
jgi:hypothetical protein